MTHIQELNTTETLVQRSKFLNRVVRCVKLHEQLNKLHLLGAKELSHDVLCK
jgi:hypothetical protein